MTMTDATTTDALALLRAWLAEMLATVGIPFHDTEPRTAGQVPLVYLAPPTLSFLDYENATDITWPLVLVQHAIDTEASQREADDLVWIVWAALGGGSMRRMADNLRTVQVLNARPSSAVNVGDVTFPAYEFDVHFQFHASICDP